MMQLDKKLAFENGGFVPAAPVKKEIKWNSPKGEHEAFVFVRLKSYQSVMAELQNNTSGHHAAARIAASIVDEQGNAVFTVEDVVGNHEHGPMSEALTIALLSAISDANGYDIKPGPKP